MQALQKRSILAVSFVLGLVVAQSAAAATVEQQRQAIFSCKTAAGIGGEASLTTSLGADPVVRIQPFDLVTEADAAEINACADRAMASGTVTVVPASSPRKAAGRSVRRGYTVPSANFLRDRRCPAAFYGLYRGNLYCFQQG